MLLTVSRGNIQQLPKSLRWHLVAFLDVYGNADIDMHFITNASIIYSSLLANETTRRKKTFFFNVLLDVQNPQKVYWWLLFVICFINFL